MNELLMDELLEQIERLAAANQALTQRLDREHSMRLAAEERVASILDIPILSFGEPLDLDPITLNDVKITVANIEGAIECIEEIELRAHEAEAALEALRADVERDRVASRSAHLIQWYGPNGEKRSASAVPMEDRAVASVCELLAAWGRLMDRNDAKVSVAEARTAARTAALWDAQDAASDAIRLLARGTR